MQKDTIKIDVGLIPNYVRDDLTAATLEFMKRILEQPGAEKCWTQKWHKKKKNRGEVGNILNPKINLKLSL